MSSCSCLTFLPGTAWVLLSKICKDFFSALYYTAALLHSSNPLSLLSCLWRPIFSLFIFPCARRASARARSVGLRGRVRRSGELSSCSSLARSLTSPAKDAPAASAAAQARPSSEAGRGGRSGCLWQTKGGRKRAPPRWLAAGCLSLFPVFCAARAHFACPPSLLRTSLSLRRN